MNCANTMNQPIAHEEHIRISDENAKLRSLLQKAANHIDALGDPMSAAMLLEAIK